MKFLVNNFFSKSQQDHFNENFYNILVEQSILFGLRVLTICILVFWNA